MAGKTEWLQIDAFLMWAKVFEENRDTAERAKRQGVTHKGVLKGLEASEGKYTVEVIPATQDDLDKVKSVLTDDLYGGRNRYKDVDLGAGKAFELERKHLNKHVFKDRETGEDKEYDFGGQPDIVWFNDEKGKNVKWDIETDGLIGNGTLAKVKFQVYMPDGTPTTADTIRLEKIGVIDHVPYQTDGGNSEDRF